MADQLHGSVHAGEEKYGVWHLSAAGDAEENHIQTVYPGKYSSGQCVFSVWLSAGRGVSAAFVYGDVFHGEDGIPPACFLSPGNHPGDGALLCRLLFAGASSVQAQVPENEHSWSDEREAAE